MGAKLDVVSANFSEAAHEREYRRVFQLAKKDSQAVDCAEAISRLVAQSLLHAGGEKVLPEGLFELAQKIDQQTGTPPHIAESLTVFAEELQKLRRNFDDVRFEKLAKAQDLWTVLVAKTCESVDVQLNIQSSLPEVAQLVAVAEKKLQVSA